MQTVGRYESQQPTAYTSIDQEGLTMRTGEAFILGTVMGGVAVWLWGREIEGFVGEKTRGVRTQAADAMREVDEKTRQMLTAAGTLCVAPKTSCRTRRGASARLSKQGKTLSARRRQPGEHSPGSAR